MPEPSEDVKFAVVGLLVAPMLQQTPLAVIGKPPSFVTFPPLWAVGTDIFFTTVVVTVGMVVAIKNTLSP